MQLRRSTTIFALAAGVLGGAALLGAASFLTPTSPASLNTQNISQEAPADISGPCDEAEHANDARCAGTAGAGTSGNGSGGLDDSGSTTTAPTVVGNGGATAGVPSSANGTHTLDAGGAGTLTYTVSGNTLSLVSASPAAGWRAEVEQSGGPEIELDFLSGSVRVQVNIEFEDGSVRERVRTRDDAAGTETRVENGQVVDHRSDDDNSGSGSNDDGTDNSGSGSDDDNSGHRSGDDDSDDDNSGSRSDDDRDDSLSSDD